MEKILFAIIGGIIGFLASIAKDYFAEKTKRKYKEIELKREKAEELYLLLDSWSNLYVSNKHHLTLVMQDDITYNEHLDYLIEEGEKRTIDYKRIEMLINIYFKQFLTSHNKIRKQMERANNIQVLHKEDYKNGNNSLKYVDSLMNEALKVSNLIDDLKNELSHFVNNLS